VPRARNSPWLSRPQIPAEIPPRLPTKYRSNPISRHRCNWFPGSRTRRPCRVHPPSIPSRPRMTMSARVPSSSFSRSIRR